MPIESTLDNEVEIEFGEDGKVVETTETPVVETDAKPEPAAKPDPKIEKPDPKPEPKGEDEDDFGEYSDRVKKRIGKEVFKRREKEREAAELAGKVDELSNLVNELRTRTATAETTTLGAREQQLSSDRARWQKAYRDAYDAGDAEKMTEAMEQLADVRVEMKRVDYQKANAPKREQPQQRQAPAQPKPDDKAVSWASENTWFGKDRVMTGAAYALDVELKEEGIDPRSDDYYTELNRRLRDAFPSKFEKAEERKPAQSNVAPVSRGGEQAAKTKKVKLSPSERAVARRLGISDEDYARYKK